MAFRKVFSGTKRGLSLVGKGAGQGLAFLGSGFAAFAGLLRPRRVAAIAILAAAVLAFYRLSPPDNTILGLVLLALALVLLAKR
jgi:hypothetical protein